MWLKSRVWRLNRAANVAGISPVRRLLGNEMTRRLVSFPIAGGMAPVTMPAERMSWVSSVRPEMAAGREPERPPGESPRERMMTWRWGESGDGGEQVRPEKEEQGSGEVKSHVEKKELFLVL